MAWLDDSPVSNAEIQGRSAFTFGVPHIFSGIWHFLAQHPLGKKANDLYTRAHRVYQSYVGPRLLPQQLNSIEKAIRSSSFQNIAMATALLRELLRAKKFAKNFLGSENEIHSRCDQLIKFLIQKSHQVVNVKETLGAATPSSAGKSSFPNSHTKMLSLMQNNMQETPAQSIPNKLYWRSDDAAMFQKKFRPQAFVYMHATCQSLFRILSNTLQLSDASEIKFCDQDPLAKDQQLVCGISLKRIHRFNLNSEKTTINPTFWQQSSTMSSLASEFFGKNLKEHIDGFFFKTRAHYDYFKTILESNQESELLNLLEKKNQIIIENSSSLKPNF